MDSVAVMWAPHGQHFATLGRLCFAGPTLFAGRGGKVSLVPASAKLPSSCQEPMKTLRGPCLPPRRLRRLPNFGSPAARRRAPSSGEPIVAAIDPRSSPMIFSSTAGSRRTIRREKFKTLQAATRLRRTAEKPTVIASAECLFAPASGRHPTGSPYITKNYITLSAHKQPRAVVLADNRGNRMGGDGSAVAAQRLRRLYRRHRFHRAQPHVLNYCNVDYEYPAIRRRISRSAPHQQAVALTPRDKHVYDNVAFCSALDTTFIRCTRSYFKDVFIEAPTISSAAGRSVTGGLRNYFPTARACARRRHRVRELQISATRGMQFSKARRGVALINCVMPVNSARLPLRGCAARRRRTRTALSDYHTKDAREPRRVATVRRHARLHLFA